MHELGCELSWAVDGPPVGVWAVASGTFSIMMHQVLTLRSDGTGVLHSWSALRGEDEVLVKWEHSGSGKLAIAMLSPPDEDDEEDDHWEIVNYRSTQIQNEAGGFTAVLCDTERSSFWLLDGPVEFRGKAE